MAAATLGRRRIAQAAAVGRGPRDRGERERLLVGELVGIGPQERRTRGSRPGPRRRRARGTARRAAAVPAPAARSLAKGTSDGPMTEPTVAAQTTIPMADARFAGPHHVGGGVARQLVRRVPEPDQHGPDHEQRERARDDGRRRDECSEHPDAIARGEPGPPVGPRHECGDQHGSERGPEDDGRARRPGERPGPEEVRSRRSSRRSRRRCARCSRARRRRRACCAHGDGRARGRVGASAVMAVDDTSSRRATASLTRAAGRYASPTRRLDREAQPVRELHLARRAAADPQQGRRADDCGDAPGPRRRDVEPVERVQELHAPRRILGRGGAHRVDAHRALLALELVDGPHERRARCRPPRRRARSPRRARCTARR